MRVIIGLNSRNLGALIATIAGYSISIYLVGPFRSLQIAAHHLFDY